MAGAKRRDKYPNFEMLRRAEPADDFRIDCRPRPSVVAIICSAWRENRARDLNHRGCDRG